MTSDSNDKSNGKDDRRQPENPFVLFRRFTDQQFQSLFGTKRKDNVEEKESKDLVKAPNSAQNDGKTDIWTSFWSWPELSEEEKKRVLDNSMREAERIQKEVEEGVRRVGGILKETWDAIQAESRQDAADTTSQRPTDYEDEHVAREKNREHTYHDEPEATAVRRVLLPGIESRHSDRLLYFGEVFDDWDTYYKRYKDTPWYPSSRFHQPLFCDAYPSISQVDVLRYLVHSPYSPVALERGHLRDHIDWRSAFEDLLLASHGKPLSEAPTVFRWQPGLSGASDAAWINSLLYRGLLPAYEHSSNTTNLWCDDRFHKNAREEEEPYGADLTFSHLSNFLRKRFRDLVEEDEDNPAVEADLYKRFENSPSQSSRQKSSQSTATETYSSAGRQSLQSYQDAAYSSSVVSTLTTTQTTRSADGTVTTKRVLKKRFADGTEESTESVNVTPGTQAKRRLDMSPQGQEAQVTVKDKSQEKGWFWS